MVHGGFVGPAYNFDLDSFSALHKWSERTQGFGLTGIDLGGLKMRSESDMRQWLKVRQAVGVKDVGVSFAGIGATHDRWNGRHGDFDFLMQTLRTAAELGMDHFQLLYLTKSSLPIIEDLVRTLDKLPTPPSGRKVRSFYHIGHGAHHESERITEEDRENLPAIATELLEEEFFLRSEREWIETIRNEEEQPQDLYLQLELTSENIDRLENMSCDDIFADLEKRARATLLAFPSFHELCETYADRNSKKIYMFSFDLERLWLERYLSEHPIEIDRSLLHYKFGRSLNPPPLWPGEAP
jgi:hypothetical protein